MGSGPRHWGHWDINKTPAGLPFHISLVLVCAGIRLIQLNYFHSLCMSPCHSLARGQTVWDTDRGACHIWLIKRATAIQRYCYGLALWEKTFFMSSFEKKSKVLIIALWVPMFSAFSFTQLSMHSIMSDGTALAFHRIETENKQTSKTFGDINSFHPIKCKM